VHETGTAVEAGGGTGLLRDSTIKREFRSSTDRRIREYPSGGEDSSPTRGQLPLITFSTIVSQIRQQVIYFI